MNNQENDDERAGAACDLQSGGDTAVPGPVVRPSAEPSSTTTAATVAAAGAVLALTMGSKEAAAECSSGVNQIGDLADPGDCVDCVSADCTDPSGDKITRDYAD